MVTALDPTWPEARSAAIIGDAEPRLLVTSAAHRELGERLATPRCPAVELPAVVAAAAPGRRPAIPSDALAFLLYTSGTTGAPKGVMRTHGAQLRSARGDINFFQVGPEDRVTLFASLAVGHAMSVVALTLLAGARLCLWDPRRRGLGGVAAWLADEAVTIYWSAASIFRVVAPSIAAPLPAMRVGRIAGEPVRGGDVALFRRHFAPSCAFGSALTATEATIYTRYILPPAAVIPEDAGVPVGHPADDADVRIIGENGGEVAPDERGEIAVGGPLLAPGYWRRPAETAEAFRPAPDGGRVVHTGDLGRQRADGCVEHAGRVGLRVKVRGTRVELEEVEAALARHAAVRAAAAAVAPDGARLVAFVVAEGAAPTADELRAHLRSTLSEAALPSAFVVLDALPLSSLGKLDRRALAALSARADAAAAPAAGSTSTVAAAISSHGATEAALAEIWSEVLGVRPPDADARFDDLGGHSLAAMRVLARVREVFGRELSFGDFLDRPTIRAMAAALTARAEAGPAADPAAKAAPPLTAGRAPVLSFAQERLWFLHQLGADPSLYNNTYGWRLDGPLDVAALERSLSEIVRRHSLLRTRIVSLDGDPAPVIGRRARCRSSAGLPRRVHGVPHLGLLGIERSLRVHAA